MATAFQPQVTQELVQLAQARGGPDGQHHPVAQFVAAHPDQDGVVSDVSGVQVVIDESPLDCDRDAGQCMGADVFGPDGVPAQVAPAEGVIPLLAGLLPTFP